MDEIVFLCDEPLIRDALVSLTRDFFPHCQVTGSGLYQLDLQSLIAERPRLAIVNLVMPGSEAVGPIRELRQSDSLVMLMASSYTHEFLESVHDLSISGFVLSSIHPAIFWEGLRRVLNGQAFFSESTDGATPAPLTNTLHASAQAVTDQRLVCLVADGLSNQEIGASCNLATGTVRNRLGSLMHDWHAHNRAQLVHIAAQRGMVN